MKIPAFHCRWRSVIILFFILCGSISDSNALQHEFIQERVLSGLTQPLALTFFPDGRMLIAQKNGNIMIAEGPDYDSTAVYLSITNIETYEERGLLGVVVDPDFDTNGFIYIYYSPYSPPYFVISRFKHIENNGGLSSNADLLSETIIWQDSEGYGSTFYHYGGSMDFGPDGKLYCLTGDKHRGYMDPLNGARAQDTSLHAGKILRINKDGSIPDGTDGFLPNPFVNSPGRDDIWALGLRNPFKSNWDLATGRLIIAEVGSNEEFATVWEDLHISKATSEYSGLNYGWPQCEGPPPFDNCPDCDMSNPLAYPVFSYQHAYRQGCMIGGMVYRGNNFPSYPYDGAYFFGDFITGVIRYITFDDELNFANDHDFAEGFNKLTAIEQGPDGYLYIIKYSGEIIRIIYKHEYSLYEYAVIAEKKIEMRGNAVKSGGMGVTDYMGKAILDQNTMLVESGTFVRAAEVSVRNGSMAVDLAMRPADIALPAFEFNRSRYINNVSIPKNSSVTLSEKYYHNLFIEKNCTVTFTQPDVNIYSLNVRDNSVLKVENCSKIRIRKGLEFGKGCIFNPDDHRAQVFIESDFTVGPGNWLNGDFFMMNGTLNVKKSASSNKSKMKGLFIASNIKSSENAEWYHDDKPRLCNHATMPSAHMIHENTDSISSSYNQEIVHLPEFPSPELLRLYPNPFTDQLHIEFQLMHDSNAKLEVFDAAGQQLATLFDGFTFNGELINSRWDALNHANGTIFIRLQTNYGVFHSKAVILK